MIQLHNRDFQQHFINVLLKLGISDYKNRKIIVEPVYEIEKWTFQTYDDIMRLQILPKARELSFEETIRLFTIWEGYYPCWIKVQIWDNQIHLKTSLRMRKAPKSNGDELYPFKLDMERS